MSNTLHNEQVKDGLTPVMRSLGADLYVRLQLIELIADNRLKTKEDSDRHFDSCSFLLNSLKESAKFIENIDAVAVG